MPKTTIIRAFAEYDDVVIELSNSQLWRHKGHLPALPSAGSLVKSMTQLPTGRLALTISGLEEVVEVETYNPR